MRLFHRGLIETQPVKNKLLSLFCSDLTWQCYSSERDSVSPVTHMWQTQCCLSVAVVKEHFIISCKENSSTVRKAPNGLYGFKSPKWYP